MEQPSATPVAPAIAAPRANSLSRPIQLAMAAVIGLFVVGVSGFAATAAVHNAAHDYRHSMGFPCH